MDIALTISEKDMKCPHSRPSPATLRTKIAVRSLCPFRLIGIMVDDTAMHSATINCHVQGDAVVSWTEAALLSCVALGVCACSGVSFVASAEVEAALGLCVVTMVELTVVESTSFDACCVCLTGCLACLSAVDALELVSWKEARVSRACSKACRILAISALDEYVAPLTASGISDARA